MKHTKTVLLKNHFDSKKFDCYDKLEIELVDLLLKEHKKLLLEKTAYKKSGLSSEEVQELAKAQAEGRLVVLPCKVGNTVYALTTDSLNGVEETLINRIVIKKNSIILNADCKNDDWGRAAWDFRPSDFGKTVFLTKEAAEKALGGADIGKDDLMTKMGEIAYGDTCNTTKLPCAECNPCCEHRREKP